MIIVWAAVFVVMLIAELATAGLVSVWFCAGSLVALILAVCGVGPVWQCVAFVGVSVLALVLTRPFVKKVLAKRTTPTNSDRVLGKRCLTFEEVNNLAGTGSVKIDGITWSARSADDSVIPKDCFVTVERIEGVKVVVRLAEEENAGAGITLDEVTIGDEAPDEAVPEE